jgi:hypothetical protein
MKHAICNYHQDEFNDWVAELSCGHNQHVRHNPPWINRIWVMSAEGRTAKIGVLLQCKKCDEDTPKDNPI